MKIKAISIVAPSGSMIVRGEKTLEVRRWRPDLSENEDLLVVENQHYLSPTKETDPDGYAIALIQIAGIRNFRHDDMKATCSSYYEDGWLAWEINNIRPLMRPFRAIAKRKIYLLEVDEENLQIK
ncbi:ASCH domain-containing protein [Paenochrobactrum sp. BZR 588]|uniref:ASCH domain-containing protein n=1 Tax=Paenochrobactrum TaxID=999488 RepID=UPI0035BBC381